MEVRVTLKDSCGSCVQFKDAEVITISDIHLTVVLSSKEYSYTFYGEHHNMKLSNIKSIKIIP